MTTPHCVVPRCTHALLACVLGLLLGCQTSAQRTAVVEPQAEPPRPSDDDTSLLPRQKPTEEFQLTAFDEEQPSISTDSLAASSGLAITGESPAADALHDDLSSLVAIAESANPTLIRLQQQANAAWAKTRHVDKLPDPTIGANVFGHPIETAAGSQRANLTIMQMIPWLDRLNAQQQQACFEALALQQNYLAQRLRVIGDLRAGYYRLYVLTRQIETIEANQGLLEALVEIANARVATGRATQGDVLLGTLELSRLEEQLITLRQQVQSTNAEMNRLMNRPVDIPITVPKELSAPAPDWTHAMLVQTAFERRPVIAAAQLQASASRWGVEVAELRRRPDFQIGASWFFIEGNRPSSQVVDVGQDAWSLGATMSIPLSRQKYDAIRDEALWNHAAASANVEDVLREFDARLLDLLEQARANHDTAKLYRDTIIPQSEQTLRADQESLTDGTVEFDRVIHDFRNLLTLEFGYHRSVGQLATSIARIRQAVGVDVDPVAREPLPPHSPVPQNETR